jgi:iron complex outermembrane receptor protein
VRRSEEGAHRVVTEPPSRRVFIPFALSSSLLLGSAAIAYGTAPAQAQDADSANISVPALPLSAALKVIAQQTGVDILFTPDSVSGLKTEPLSGRMSARQAIGLLIENTELEVISGGPGSLVVRHVLAARKPPAPPAEAVAVPARPAMPDVIEEVVVTGTSIRGVAPVGSNLMTVDRATIDDTAAVDVEQMLKTVPAITDFAGSGIGQLPGISYYSPTIHSLGSSGSNSTLVLIDGHRLPEGGNQHVLADPNMIPAIAVQRIEVLADGSSSVYGSDAVAGVVNFITRKRYAGLEIDAQGGIGADYGTLAAGILFGNDWDSGWAMAAYGYSRTANGRADYKARPYTVPDKTQLAIQTGLLPAGTAPSSLTDSSTFNCDPATIQMAGAATIFSSAAATAAAINLPQNSPCPYGATLQGSYAGTGAETRNSAMFKLEQDVGKLTVETDIDFSYRDTYSHTASGMLTATVYQTGPQANPFYRKPTGYSGTATSETIRWDPTDLLGYGLNDNHSEDWYGILNEEYRLNNNIRVTASQTIGNDESVVITGAGALNSSAATLALNGTANTPGNTATPSIAGTNYVLLNLPLTTSNALDVWDPATGNKTSKAVLASLTNNRSAYHGTYLMKDFHLGMDGSLLELPGGPLRFAAGGEWLAIIQDSENDYPGNFGPVGQSATIAYYPLKRNVYSYFGELDIPLVSPDMSITLVRSLDFDISGRYDDYSDVGPTANPNFAAEWGVIDGLKIRANISTSFVAPSQRSVGNPALQGLNSLSRVTPNTTSATVPTATFPNIIGDPGCSADSSSCQINSTVVGVYRYTGNPATKPERGRAWNIGMDYAPDFLPDFDLSWTLFDNKFIGGVTSPPINSIINNSSLNYRLAFCNPGAPCTQQQIIDFIGNVPVTQALPAQVYYLYDQSQTNVFNLALEGMDIGATYTYQTSRWGSFTASLSATDFLQFDENYNGSPQFSILNTSGYNTSFPSIALQSRLNIRWNFQGFTTSLTANYVGGYRNWSSTTINPITLATVAGQSVPSGGGDPVKANYAFDAHIGYDLMHLGNPALGNSQLYLDVRNLFNANPPYYNSTAGYDPFGASNLGRVISIGVRAKY